MSKSNTINGFELFADKLIATCDELDQLMEVYPPAYVKKSRNLEECYRRICAAQATLEGIAPTTESDAA